VRWVSAWWRLVCPAGCLARRRLTTAADGKNYQIKHYSLQAIIAVGFKIENERAVQFRKWANTIIESFTIKGYAMDDDANLLTAAQAENARLIAVLEVHGIDWRLPPQLVPVKATAIETSLFNPHKVALFRGLFSGRTDVFPQRCENKSKGKSGCTAPIMTALRPFALKSRWRSIKVARCWC
jgi:hypothetical protein